MGVSTHRLRTLALLFLMWASVPASVFAVGRVTLPMSCISAVFFSPSLFLLFLPSCFFLSLFGFFSSSSPRVSVSPPLEQQ